jgi:3D (Asp-Asp-Asp) domain-containing protein
MTQQQISTVLAQADAARVRTQQVVRAAAAASTTSVATSVAAPGVYASATTGRTITVSATGYALPGRTSTGLPVGWGVVAVDPSVIPLGTHMTIPGYGEAVAADTGGAVSGSTIDLWFPSVAQANAWGRRVVTVTLH